MKHSGHQEIHGENIAQFEFSQAGWNPFKHYVDEDQVDLILRRRNLPHQPEYREVQVKWCRTWEGPKWVRELFNCVSWRHFTTEDFINHRPQLFVAFVIPNAQQIYIGDIFIFTSCHFHELVLRAPYFTQGTNRKCFQLAHSRDGRWFLLLQRNKFAHLNDQTVLEITSARRNFRLLDKPLTMLLPGNLRVKHAEEHVEASV